VHSWKVCIRSDSGGKVNVLGGDTVGHGEEKLMFWEVILSVMVRKS
jgi:hypothetical protein